MNKSRLYLSLVVFCQFGAAADAATLSGQTAMPVTTTKALASPVPATQPPVPEYATYTYYGDRYRDPFVPLIGGDTHQDSALDRPPQIAALQLKGIVQDAKGRMALLVSGVSSYVLRGGRLYDGRNKMVKSISGVIKAESVVLIGSDRTVREIRSKPTL